MTKRWNKLKKAIKVKSIELFFILPVSWTQWTTKYLQEPRIVQEHLSGLDWVNNRKVDMVLLEQCLLKIAEAQRA